MGEIIIPMSDWYNVYTHNDLDGAVSLLTFLWSRDRDDGVSWKSYNNLQINNIIADSEQNTDNVNTLILDLALREEFHPSLDRENITFIDHHESSEPFLNKFQKAKILYKNTTSNALWMAQLFKGEKYPTRTDAQKMLIALADDFDCYRLNIPESYDLNILFWSEYKNKFTKFIKDYSQGFKPFSPEQKKAISYLKSEAEKEANNLPLFTGEINFGTRKKRVLATMSEGFSNICNDLLMKRHKPDVFFFINPKTEKVAIRQYTKEDPINVGSFAEKICDGGGHKHAGGGKITPLFMEVTKNLHPLNK